MGGRWSVADRSLLLVCANPWSAQRLEGLRVIIILRSKPPMFLSLSTGEITTADGPDGLSRVLTARKDVAVTEQIIKSVLRNRMTEVRATARLACPGARP